MKQKVKAVSIIRDKEKILLLKNKSGGFELPQTTINFDEQPEQALCRYLSTVFSDLKISRSELADVLAYYGQNRGVLFIVYELLALTRGVKLSDYQDKYLSVDFVESSDNRIDDLSRFILSVINQQSIKKINSEDGVDRHKGEVSLFCDGASRGNPGESAAGFVIIKDGQVVESKGEFLGITVSSQAEYHSLKIGLEAVLETGADSVSVFMDNLMVINQMKGYYKVKNRELWPIYDHIKKIISQFKYVDFNHISREKNRLADEQANLALDNALKDSGFRDIIE